MSRALVLLLLLQAPPTLNEKAVEFLRSAQGIIAGTAPEFQPAALLQLATVQSSVDRKKAVALYQLAIASSIALPQRENLRSRFLAMSVAALARVDVDAAMEKLLVIPEAPAGEPDPRMEPLQQIVNILIEKSGKKPEKPIEALERFGFSYRAAISILKLLPLDDSRRLTLLSLAHTAFAQRPDIDEYERFVRALRPQQFPDAVRAMVQAALDGKGIVNRRSQTITGSEGTVSLNDPKEVVLFNLSDLVRATDPDLLGRMTEGHPALQQALKLFPNGRQSVERGDVIVTEGTLAKEGVTEEQARTQRLVTETQRFQEVMTYYVKDPPRALQAARAIPTAVLKVRAIVTIAMNQKEDGGLRILEDCVKALDEVRPVGLRATGWASLANAADRFHDRPLALKLLERGINDARELYKTDADSDAPNIAPRSFWPSAAAFRALFYRAAKLLGADAETLLERCPDADVQALGRIEIAAAWLNVPSQPATTQVFRRER